MTMSTRIERTIQFGRNGNAEPFQLSGWSGPEDGFAWTIGAEAKVKLPPMTAAFGFWIEINLAPFLHAPAIPSQSLTLRLGGAKATTQLAFVGTFAWYFPAEVANTGVLVLEVPDHAKPSDVGVGGDTRDIAVQVRSIRILAVETSLPTCKSNAPARGPATTEEVQALSAMPIKSFLTSFEPLIGNCEFGFLQRRCGAEPLALLRWADPNFPAILRGIDTGFEGLGAPDDIQPDATADGSQWMINEREYHLRYHTFRSPHDVDAATVRDDEMRKLPFLRRKLMEDIGEGHKIFVCKDAFHVPANLVIPIFLALNRHGPCKLLWLTESDPRMSGAVNWVLPGLMHGRIGRFAPIGDPAAAPVGSWLAACVGAWTIAQNCIRA
jgi:hypothetical protein